MESLFNKMRTKVSADKYRYRDGSHDLDLTYISDRVIAMAFPSAGLESAYRNPIDDVAEVCRENHGKYFLVYNLSERPYDNNKFDQQVISWCGFPDHLPPPWALLLRIINHVHEWLVKDPRNVVVIHCLAGKGRTGTIMACYFMYCGLFDNADEALNFFACKRSLNNWGVTGPAQLRYVYHFERMLKKGKLPSRAPLLLKSISFHTIPRYTINPGKQGVCPLFEIYSVSKEKHLIYSSERIGEEIKSIPANLPGCTFNINCILQGDVLVVFKHITALYGTENMFFYVFHTGMVESYEMVLAKCELEKAHKDPRYASDFTVSMSFAPLAPEVVSQFKPIEDEVPFSIVPDNISLDGSICFSNYAQEKVAMARDLGNPLKGSTAEKGGYLTKRGHKVKSWKRRWFVLKDDKFSYLKSPRDSIALGEIALETIQKITMGVFAEKPFCFEIQTYSKVIYLISADTEKEMRAWAQAVAHARTLAKRNEGQSAKKQYTSVPQQLLLQQQQMGPAQQPAQQPAHSEQSQQQPQASEKKGGGNPFVHHREPSHQTTSTTTSSLGSHRSVHHSTQSLQVTILEARTTEVLGGEDEELNCIISIGQVKHTSTCSIRNSRLFFNETFTFTDIGDFKRELTISLCSRNKGTPRLLGETVLRLDDLSHCLNQPLNDWVTLSKHQNSATLESSCSIHIILLAEGGVSLPVLPNIGVSGASSNSAWSGSTFEEDHQFYTSPSRELVGSGSGGGLIGLVDSNGAPRRIDSPLLVSTPNSRGSLPSPLFLTPPTNIEVDSLHQPSPPSSSVISFDCWLEEEANAETPNTLVQVNDLVWSGQTEGTISVWNSITRVISRKFKGHESVKINKMVVVKGRVWTASEKDLKIWDPNNYTVVVHLTDISMIRAMCVVETDVGEFVWTGCSSDDSGGWCVLAWNASDPSETPPREVLQIDHPISAIHQVNQDSIWIGSHTYIYIHHPKTLVRTRVLKAHKTMIRALLTVGSYVWSFSDDQESGIRIWSPTTYEPIATLSFLSKVSSVTSDGKDFVITSMQDGSILVWNAQTKSVEQQLAVQSEPIRAMLLLSSSSSSSSSSTSSSSSSSSKQEEETSPTTTSSSSTWLVSSSSDRKKKLGLWKFNRTIT